ncbi:hypothetical protein COLO4_16490 [Corchorus olitorius]|uniref:Uncharacterized protein n=1 Tax=Corchorus olitorius TaxID=93759 RepID=A0A1R3JH54_9ROSI|nr:hypothetical protein COLO4_16490 [Corchorus olitorius]
MDADYQKKTHRLCWVYKDNSMVFRKIKYVPGLYRIFNEILDCVTYNKQGDSVMDTVAYPWSMAVKGRREEGNRAKGKKDGGDRCRFHFLADYQKKPLKNLKSAMDADYQKKNPSPLLSLQRQWYGFPQNKVRSRSLPHLQRDLRLCHL